MAVLDREETLQRALDWVKDADRKLQECQEELRLVRVRTEGVTVDSTTVKYYEQQIQDFNTERRDNKQEIQTLREKLKTELDIRDTL